MCSPRFYLQHTDLVCAGEGESVMTALLEGEDPTAIAGLGYKTPDGQVQINALPDLIDLNRQPVPYLELDNGFLLQDGQLKRLRENVHLLRPSYLGLTIRGCPYACSYCINSRLKEVFRRKGPFIRFIETDLVIKELAWAVKNIPHLKSVTLDDDDFFLRTEQAMEAFLKAYRSNINLPFYYLQATIKQVTESKLKLLRKYGIRMTFLKIGLQSASKRISNEIFDRDVLHSVRPLAAIKRPVKIYDHKLMYYPGTKLYKKALQDGIIPKDYISQVLLRRNTVRKHDEDLDNDTLVIALFNIAVRKSRFSLLAYGTITILCLKPVFRLYTRLDIVKKGRKFARVPLAHRWVRKLQQEGLW
jgi:anaerobic magnesium-protoporphyrin IX monomethyl ester cyclase